MCLVHPAHDSNCPAVDIAYLACLATDLAWPAMLRLGQLHPIQPHTNRLGPASPAAIQPSGYQDEEHDCFKQSSSRTPASSNFLVIPTRYERS